MNIQEALAQQIKLLLQNIKQDRIIMNNGLFSIHDAVFKVTLYKLGVDKKTIADWMLEPVENRDEILGYYENIKSNNN